MSSSPDETETPNAETAETTAAAETSDDSGTAKDKIIMAILAALIIVLAGLLVRSNSSAPTTAPRRPAGPNSPIAAASNAARPRPPSSQPHGPQQRPSPGPAGASVAPAPESPGTASPAGEPPERDNRQEYTLEDLPRITNTLMDLDESGSLTADQRAQLAKAATDLYTATARMQVDLYKILAVLNDAQFEELFRPHPNSTDRPGPGGSEGDPRIMGAIAALEKKAGSSGKAVDTETRVTPPNVDARSVAEGLTYLESTSDQALSPEQARTALDALKDWQESDRRAVTVVTEMLATLTPDQKGTLQSRAPAPTQTMLLARCLLLWSQKR